MSINLRGVASLIVVAVVVVALINKLGGSVESELAKEAAEFNKGAPKMVGPGVRIDSVTVGPGRRLTYNVTLVDITRNDVNVAMMQLEMRSKMAMFGQSDPHMKQLRDNKIELHFVFKDKNGALIFEDSLGSRGG